MGLNATEAEKVWLAEIHRLWLAGETVNTREMMVRLRDDLGPGFLPRKVNLAFGGPDHISALGLHQIEPRSPLFADADKLIRAVKELFRQSPNTTQLKADWAASQIGRDLSYTARLLQFIGTLGNFSSGGTGSLGTGFAIMDISRDENVAEFLDYQDIESQLEREANRYRGADFGTPRVLAEPPTSAPMLNTAFVLMQINPANKELVDVLNGIKDACALFELGAKGGRHPA